MLAILSISSSGITSITGRVQTAGFAVFLLTLLAFPASSARAQSPVQNPVPRLETWVPNWSVSAIARTDDTIFIGGGFTYVRPYTGHGVPIDALSGEPVPTFPDVDGGIYTAVSDGVGGWYIGGAFTQVGGVTRNRIAHILANGMVDHEWDPNANDDVQSLVVADSTIFMGGRFTSVGGQARYYIAALDAATGDVTTWSPSANSRVTALAASGSTIYLGGEFTRVSGVTRNHIAALDAATGAVTPWIANSDGAVNAFAFSDSTVYVGGHFNTVGGQARSCIAAVDAVTGDVTPWDPDASASHSVNVHALTVSDSTVYVGGSFTNIGGQPRNHIAALDAATGEATAWNPSAEDAVRAITVSDSTIYVGGLFTSIGGQMRRGIAALDATTGAATPWDPAIGGSILTLAVSGSTVYAGGYFLSTDAQTRHNLAALDAATGAATPWDPNPSGATSGGHITAMAVSGSTIYVSGNFTSIGSQPRNGLAAVDVTTGAVAAWDPNPGPVEQGLSPVWALAVSGSTVYAGGRFESIGGQPRNHIAALDAITGAATAWNPDSNSTVYALAASGSTVYAGGVFGSIGGQTRIALAALDATTGAATAWNPGPSGGSEYGPTISVLEVSGSTIYAGGLFTSIGGQLRRHLAALDATTGLATSWNPYPNDGVRALSLSGPTIYVGGDFTGIGGRARNRIAGIDTVTGAATEWNPNPDSSVVAIEASGSVVWVGGQFTRIGGRYWPYFAHFIDNPSGVALH